MARQHARLGELGLVRTLDEMLVEYLLSLARPRPHWETSPSLRPAAGG
jgi:hypothetical protein